MLKFHKWIVDTIHGYIGITKEEAEILDHSVSEFSPIQRLRRVSQLGWVFVTYPTATHTRFEHSLGTMHLAGKIAENIGLREKQIRRARIAALLHDIGHGPFSHDSENVLRFFKRMSHEDFTESMINEFYELEKYGFSTKEIAREATSRKKSIISQILFGKEEHSRLSVDADFLDYVLRDDFYSGIRVAAVDLSMIMKAFVLWKGKLALYPISLLPVMSAINARSHLGLRVYFHKTSDFAESMWMKALYYAVVDGLELEDIWMMGDYEALDYLKKNSGLSGELAVRLNIRDINKWAVAARIREYINSIPIKKAKCEPISVEDVEKLSMLRRKLNVKEELENDLAKQFNVKPGHLILCIPANPPLKPEEMSSSIYFLEDNKMKRYEEYIPLDSVCETNKIVYSASVTVPAKDRKRVAKMAQNKRVFRNILSTI